jgi:hypothetical protein
VERFINADEFQGYKDEADRAFRSRENARSALCEIRLLRRVADNRLSEHQNFTSVKPDRALSYSPLVSSRDGSSASATGMIEGACRFVIIGDRFGITGARWSPDGADVVVDLDDYMNYYKTRYRNEIHLTRYVAASVADLGLTA